jgi:hypothetical protein
MRFLGQRARSEEGHAPPFLLSIVAGVGAIALGIGAAEDSYIVAVVGGVVLGVGVVASLLVHHTAVDYDIYRRLNDLEK